MREQFVEAEIDHHEAQLVVVLLDRPIEEADRPFQIPEAGVENREPDRWAPAAGNELFEERLSIRPPSRARIPQAQQGDEQWRPIDERHALLEGGDRLVQTALAGEGGTEEPVRAL